MTEQKLEIGLTIIWSTRDFEKSLGEWNDKVPTTKTWASFKTHFTRAQTDLEAIRGPTIKQEGFHHANMLAERLRTNLQLQGSQMLVIVQEMSTQDNKPPADDAPQPEPAVNAGVQDSVQLEILRLLREIARDR